MQWKQNIMVCPYIFGNFDKDIKIEGKNFYMPSGKLKIGSTAHVEVIKKTTTNSRLVIDGKLLYV